MKSLFILASVAVMAASSPALAKGKGGSLLGVIAPITTNVGKVTALNNVAVLSGNNVASGNTVGISVPINVSKNNVLNGLLGGRGHGCGCN